MDIKNFFPFEYWKYSQCIKLHETWMFLSKSVGFHVFHTVMCVLSDILYYVHKILSTLWVSTYIIYKINLEFFKLIQKTSPIKQDCLDILQIQEAIYEYFIEFHVYELWMKILFNEIFLAMGYLIGILWLCINSFSS